jgi:hypothetical protein
MEFSFKGVKSDGLSSKLKRAIDRYNLHLLLEEDVEIIEDDNLPRLLGSRGNTIYIKSFAQSSSIDLLALFLAHELAHLKGVKDQRKAMEFALSYLKFGILKRLKVKMELFLSEAYRVKGEIDKTTELAMKNW